MTAALPILSTFHTSMRQNQSLGANIIDLTESQDNILVPDILKSVDVLY